MDFSTLGDIFDSENIPLSTRIEVGPGLIHKLVLNDDEEAVNGLALDSDYVDGLVNKALPINPLLLGLFNSRLEKIESLLGITVVLPVTETATDSDVFSSIQYVKTSGGAAINANATIAWQILNASGTEIISKTVTFAGGSTPENIMKALVYSIIKTSDASSYISECRTDDNVQRVLIRFNKTTAKGFTVAATLTTTHANDSSDSLVVYNDKI